VLGGLFAILAAATLAFNNVSVRRGVLTGTVAQAIFITVPIGVPIFFLIALAFGQLGTVAGFSDTSILLLCLAGLIQFVLGRYCNYKSTEALGANLAGPVTEMSLVVSLVLAIVFLGEVMTPLRILGILLTFIGPVIILRTRKKQTARAPGSAKPEFRPRYILGYIFAVLCALSFGTTPILIRTALTDVGATGSIAGGLVSYGAATAFVALILLWPGRFAHARAISGTSARWFTLSGVFVCISQMFRYMALAIAPVSVVQPLQQTATVFRVIFSWMLNREHEAFDVWVIVGIAVSLIGGLCLTLSVDLILNLLTLSDFLIEIV
jgi:drug/metabolite transporter (DMT)-like permease